MNAEEKNHFLSNETTEAIVIATKSTIAKIEHLLEAEYQFVLSQKFKSDNQERKFSAFHQANGGNYNMNARAAIFGVEKILRTGITYSVMNCNVALRTEKHDRRKNTSIRETSVPYPKVDILSNFDDKDLAVLEEPKKPAGSLDNKNYNYIYICVCVCVCVCVVVCLCDFYDNWVVSGAQ
jgi:hypothetical protein